MTAEGTVTQLARYPVKSMQGTPVDHLDVEAHGVEGDREWALHDVATDRLMSAKRFSRLFDASADPRAITLPDGTIVPLGAGDADAVLSAWLGREVELRRRGGDAVSSYEMTFDPPNDDAEYFAIDAPAGAFVDLAPLHVVSAQTLDGCAAARPDLDWDVRRFRPNVVVDVPGLEAFGEDGWCGRKLAIGDAVLEPRQPTVRCAMPLRSQPGLERQPTLYEALDELHANHLGIYVWVVDGARISVGDPVAVLD